MHPFAAIKRASDCLYAVKDTHQDGSVDVQKMVMFPISRNLRCFGLFSAYRLLKLCAACALGSEHVSRLSEVKPAFKI
jgi:hypothetical protein